MFLLSSYFRDGTIYNNDGSLLPTQLLALSMPKSTKDFDGLWKECVSMVKSEPTPPYPDLPLAPAKLSKDQIKVFSGEIDSNWGYPLIEAFLNPGTVRLLIQNTPRVKYEHYSRTHFLALMRLFEDSQPNLLDCCVNISSVVNDPFFPSVNIQRARSVMIETKRNIRDYLGLQFQPDSYKMMFVTRQMVMESHYYHDRNLVRTGTRAYRLNQGAYTRGLLGDEQFGKVPSDINVFIESGEHAYIRRSLGGKDTRAHSVAHNIPRHLL